MRVIFAVVLLLAILSPEIYARRHQEAEYVRNGEWGGYGIGMQVEPASTGIGFDCASGSINQPITLDRRGHFDVPGTLIRFPGGPIPGDHPPVSRPARYSGYVHGKTMFVTVELADTMEVVGTFILTYGQSPFIVFCA